MKTSLRFLNIFIIFGVFVGFKASATGGMDAGGGNTQVCFSDSQTRAEVVAGGRIIQDKDLDKITSVKTLDYILASQGNGWEGQTFPLHQLLAGETPLRFVQRILTHYGKFIPSLNITRHIEKYPEIPQENIYWINEPLKKIFDEEAQVEFESGNCVVTTAARQIQKDKKTLLYFDARLWKHSSQNDLSRAALIAHELFYFRARKEGALDSLKVQHLLSRLLQNRNQDMKTFTHFVNELGFSDLSPYSTSSDLLQPTALVKKIDSLWRHNVGSIFNTLNLAAPEKIISYTELFIKKSRERDRSYLPDKIELVGFLKEFEQARLILKEIGLTEEMQDNFCKPYGYGGRSLNADLTPKYPFEWNRMVWPFERCIGGLEFLLSQNDPRLLNFKGKLQTTRNYLRNIKEQRMNALARSSQILMEYWREPKHFSNEYWEGEPFIGAPGLNSVGLGLLERGWQDMTAILLRHFKDTDIGRYCSDQDKVNVELLPRLTLKDACFKNLTHYNDGADDILKWKPSGFLISGTYANEQYRNEIWDNYFVEAIDYSQP